MKTQQSEFNASATLAAIREARSVRRRRCTWGKSRLAPYLSELVKLRNEGASFADLTFWLLKQKRLKVDRTTVRRFLMKQPAKQSEICLIDKASNG